MKPLEYLLYPFGVAVFSSPYEIVVGDVEALPDLLESFHNPVYQGHRTFSTAMGGPKDLLPMFISAGQEEHVLPFKSMVPCQDIGRYGGVGMSYVRYVVYVINGCSEIEFTQGAGKFPPVSVCLYYPPQGCGCLLYGW